MNILGIGIVNHDSSATFYDGKSLFWGRKIKYTVKDQPFSVMEVFLIK